MDVILYPAFFHVNTVSKTFTAEISHLKPYRFVRQALQLILLHKFSIWGLFFFYAVQR